MTHTHTTIYSYFKFCVLYFETVCVQRINVQLYAYIRITISLNLCSSSANSAMLNANYLKEESEEAFGEESLQFESWAFIL